MVPSLFFLSDFSRHTSHTIQFTGSSVRFSAYPQSCTTCTRIALELSRHPVKKVGTLSLPVPPNPPAPGNHWSAFCLCRFVGPHSLGIFVQLDFFPRDCFRDISALLHKVIVYPFLLLCNIFPDIFRRPVPFISSTVGGYFVSSFLVSFTSCCYWSFSPRLCACVQGWAVSGNGIVEVQLQRTRIFRFSRVGTRPPVVLQASCCLTSLPTLGIGRLTNFCLSDGF